MSERVDKSVENFIKGTNCSQAVICAFCEDYGVPVETAMKMTGAYGSGMQDGSTCGVISGAFAVIGLKHSAITPEDQEQKKLCAEKAKEFLAVFAENYESTACRDLKDPESRVPCEKLVKYASEILEKLEY